MLHTGYKTKQLFFVHVKFFVLKQHYVMLMWRSKMKHKTYQQNWYQNQNEKSPFQNVVGVMLKKQTSFSLFLGSSTPITK
jgi:hypothetical protein